MNRQLAITTTAALLLAAVVVIWRAPPTQFLTASDKPVAALGGGDSFMTSIVTRIYDAQGSVKAQINARETQFYRSQQNAELNAVTLLSNDAAGRPITLSGARGSYFGDSNELELNGDVVINLDAPSGATQLRGEQFRYQLLSQIATSQQPLTITSASGELSAEQLYADLQQQRLKLSGGVHGHHQPQ